MGKSAIVRETRRFPEVLDRYRQDKRTSFRPPLDHLEIASYEGTPQPDWDELLHSVHILPTGNDNSRDYEKAIEALLSALFYPSLTNPYVQTRIHEGRKIIDITYVNSARSGFFYWLGMNYSAAQIMVECKNYGGEIENPELDQMAGRFSPSRGQFGLIMCRRFRNKELFMQRCRDTVHDQRGFIIGLDDNDLGELVNQRRQETRPMEFSLLIDQLRSIIN
jgi:hypothetical protein